jgi:uncharacterized metal-binding protein YceD (DUF177 family)
MSGFIIDLAALGQGHSRIEARAPATALDLPEEVWPGLVEAVIKAERSGDKVTLQGRVRAQARFECVRCLRSFEKPFDVGLTVFADRASRTKRGEEELLERDHEMRFHDGRQLDLREEAREALLLEVPMAAHCSEECLGLCPRCGADLNQGPHDCPAPALQSPGRTNRED